MCSAEMENICSQPLSTNLFPLLIYTTLSSSVSPLTRSLLTPPTLSSVVSYSAHVLILLLHPHILQTPAKFWLSGGSRAHTLTPMIVNTHTPYPHSQLNTMTASQNTIQRLIEWPDGANCIVPDVHGRCH